MSSYSLTFQNISSLLRPDQLLTWLRGGFFALILYFGTRKIKHFLAMLGILIGSIAVFFLVLLLSGLSVQGATEGGLLLGQVSGQAIEKGQADRGARLLGVRETLRASVYVEDFYPFMVRERERHIAAARAQLGEEAFNKAWSEGAAMTLDQAIEYALKESE